MKKIISALFGLLLLPTVALAQYGPPPSPWVVNGPDIYYNTGGVLLGSAVTGGSKGAGTLNATGLYVGGAPLALQSALGLYLPLTGGVLSGGLTLGGALTANGSAGTLGYNLISQGAGVSPIWSPVGAGTVTSVTCNGAAITVSGTCSTIGQIPGIATNNDASAGNVGEYISNSNNGASYTGAGAGQNTNSISLTAGDWDITGNCVVGIGAATTTQFGCTISTASGTVNTPIGAYILMPGISNNSGNQAATVGPVRVSLAGPTTYYMNMFVSVGSGSVTVGGVMRARRVR